MKKKAYLLGMAVLLAALLALPGVGQSAMWVGAELGGNFPLSSSVDLSAPGGGSLNAKDVNFTPSVIGGATIGYDFVNAGFGGYAWPDWMKYFSFAMDFTYNQLNTPSSETVKVNGVSTEIGRFNGNEKVLTFLFMAHYGFFPDSEIPTGRVNPYIGVGPAIIWSTLDSGTLGGGTAHATNVGLVVEPGIRWVCFKQVSIDTAMRYRYASPSWDFGNGNATAKINGLNQLAFLVRANYHF
jgi:outer membrane protein W